MADQSTSQLRIYSLGIAANNKEIDSLELSVIPIERTPFLDGELVSMPFETEVSGEEDEGSAFNAKVTSDTSVKATWLPLHGNRATPEDIRRGQRVLLWKFADRNDLYWTYAGLDDHLFKEQTVVFRVSATADEDADSLAADNCYYVEICTRKGAITIQTSKANGEFSTYAFQIATKVGKVVLCDEFGNSFMLDSVNTLMELENADGTFVRLDQEIIDAYAPDAINVKSNNSINFETDKFNVKANDVTVTSTTNTFDTPNSAFTGNVAVQGNLGVGGSFSGSGSATFASNVLFEGSVTFQQRIQANGITSTSSINGPSGSI